MKGKANEFVIGTVVGTETVVSARYCTGKARCAEDCRVPKDEFVEAIGGNEMDSTDEERLAVAVWDKEDPNDPNGAKDAAANAKLTPASPKWADVEASRVLQDFFVKLAQGGDIASLAPELDTKIESILNG